MAATKITDGVIGDAEIITTKINDGAVTTAKINDLGVTTAKIANDAVDYTKLSFPAYETQSGNDTLTAADYGRFINCSGMTGDTTITLPSAATVGNGWWVRIIRDSNDVAEKVTVSRAGSDTIRYGSDLSLTSLLMVGDGDYLDFVSTGSGWLAMGNLTVYLHAKVNLVSGGQTISNATITKIAYDNVEDDPHSAFDATDDDYTIPFSGQYYVTASSIFQTIGSVNYDVFMYMYVNNTNVEISHGGGISADSGSQNSFNQVQLSGIHDFVKGDVVDIRCQQLSGATRNINDSDFNGELSTMTAWRMVRLGNRR